MSPLCDHPEFGPPRRYVSESGPTEGVWLVRDCLTCNAGTVQPEGGGSGYDSIIAALWAAGSRREGPEA